MAVYYKYRVPIWVGALELPSAILDVIAIIKGYKT